jgi:flagellar hook-basal body complex protein FliE
MDPIRILPRAGEIGGLAPTPERTQGARGDGSFAATLERSLAEVNRLQQSADASITALASGGKASLHDTMIAMEQADVSFRLLMQVRNKIVDAYQEIMRMQV